MFFLFFFRLLLIIATVEGNSFVDAPAGKHRENWRVEQWQDNRGNDEGDYSEADNARDDVVVWDTGEGSSILPKQNV